MTKEYVGKGATTEEQRLNRARALVAREREREEARKLKLSTRSNRLALLKRAADKRKRRRLRNMANLVAPIVQRALDEQTNAPDRES